MSFLRGGKRSENSQRHLSDRVTRMLPRDAGEPRGRVRDPEVGDPFGRLTLDPRIRIREGDADQSLELRSAPAVRDRTERAAAQGRIRVLDGHPLEGRGGVLSL